MHRLLEILRPLPPSCPLFLEEGLSPTSLRQQKSGESVFPYLLITLKHIHNLAIFIPPFLIPMSHLPTHSCTHEQTPSESLCSGDLSLSLYTLRPSHIAPLLKVPLHIAVLLPPPPAAALSAFSLHQHGVSFMPTHCALSSFTPLRSAGICPVTQPSPPPPPTPTLSVAVALERPATFELPGPAPPGLSAAVDVGATCSSAPVTLLLVLLCL